MSMIYSRQTLEPFIPTEISTKGAIEEDQNDIEGFR